MGNETEERREDKGNKEKPVIKKKEVLISVYTEGDHSVRESNKTRSRITTKVGQDVKIRGYDRRSRLLAYAQELRQKAISMPKPEENPKNTEDHKFKVKRTSYQNLETRVRSRKKYQRLVPEVNIHCRPKSLVVDKTKKSGGRNNFRFMGVLRKALTGFCRE